MSLQSTKKTGKSAAQNGARKTEFDHDRILILSLAGLIPAVVNEKVYKPVDPDDPDLQALADSIAQHGLREPIVVTLDHAILSGHRRHAACKLAGLTHVRCRRVNVLSTNPEFLTLLVEHNRQRVKSSDERLREEVIAADPEESYRRLVDHRKRQARVDVATIEIIGHKRRAIISSAKRPLLDAVLAVLQDREDYWPLSDRQIHYALLNKPPLIHAKKPDSRYSNDERSYKALIDLVTRARLDGSVPWESIHDPTRPVVIWNAYREAGMFMRQQVDDFLKGYYRDLMQSQPNHIEIIGEKNTIESVVRRVAADYCIPFTIGRGYCSLPPRREMALRFQRSGKEKLVLLVLSDFDPEGEDIAHSFARSMRDDFGVDQIEPVKVALTKAQVREMGLPPILKAKRSSSRYKSFVAEHGHNVFELEAVPPDRLQRILRKAIDAVIDRKTFNAEIDAEKDDAAFLDGVRRRIHVSLEGIGNQK